jgi:hypothetical protein
MVGPLYKTSNLITSYLFNKLKNYIYIYIYRKCFNNTIIKLNNKIDSKNKRIKIHLSYITNTYRVNPRFIKSKILR